MPLPVPLHTIGGEQNYVRRDDGSGRTLTVVTTGVR